MRPLKPLKHGIGQEQTHVAIMVRKLKATQTEFLHKAKISSLKVTEYISAVHPEKSAPPAASLPPPLLTC